MTTAAVIQSSFIAVLSYRRDSNDPIKAVIEAINRPTISNPSVVLSRRSILQRLQELLQGIGVTKETHMGGRTIITRKNPWTISEVDDQ